MEGVMSVDSTSDGTAPGAPAASAAEEDGAGSRGPFAPGANELASDGWDCSDRLTLRRSSFNSCSSSSGLRGLRGEVASLSAQDARLDDVRRSLSLLSSLSRSVENSGSHTVLGGLASHAVLGGLASGAGADRIIVTGVDWATSSDFEALELLGERNLDSLRMEECGLCVVNSQDLLH